VSFLVSAAGRRGVGGAAAAAAIVQPGAVGALVVLWTVPVVGTGGGRRLVPVEGVSSGGVAGSGAGPASAVMVVVAVGGRSMVFFRVVTMI